MNCGIYTTAGALLVMEGVLKNNIADNPRPNFVMEGESDIPEELLPPKSGTEYDPAKRGSR